VDLNDDLCKELAKKEDSLHTQKNKIHGAKYLFLATGYLVKAEFVLWYVH